MKFNDIISGVQALCDDQDGTYITPDYVMSFANLAYKWIYGKLRLTDADFDVQVVVLPAVDAGTPDLSQFQLDDGPLATLVSPRQLRWKLAGTPVTQWSRADGPLDFVRDIQNPIPAIDSWAWLRYVIKLSNFSTALDLEVSGDFLFDPLTDPESKIQISIVADLCLTCKIASFIGKARGNDKWKVDYSADAVDALDDLAIAMVKADQAKTARVGRMNRRGKGRGQLSTSAGTLI